MFVIDSGYCKLKVRDGAGGRILGLHPEALNQALVLSVRYREESGRGVRLLFSEH